MSRRHRNVLALPVPDIPKLRLLPTTRRAQGRTTRLSRRIALGSGADDDLRCELVHRVVANVPDVVPTTETIPTEVAGPPGLSVADVQI